MRLMAKWQDGGRRVVLWAKSLTHLLIWYVLALLTQHPSGSLVRHIET